jgi:hypothetical protein
MALNVSSARPGGWTRPAVTVRRQVVMGGPAHMACGGHTAMRSLSGALRYRPSPEGAACHNPLGGQRRAGHSGRVSRGGEHGHPPDRQALRYSLHQPGGGHRRGGPRRRPGRAAGFGVHPDGKVAPPSARWSPAPGGILGAGPGAGTGAEADERVFARWPDRRSPRRAHAGLRGSSQVSRVRQPSGHHEVPGARGRSRGLPAARGGRRCARRTTRRIARQPESGAARHWRHGDRSTAARIPGRTVPGPRAGRRLGTTAGPGRPAASAAHVIPGADEARRGLPVRRDPRRTVPCPVPGGSAAPRPGATAGAPPA